MFQRIKSWWSDPYNKRLIAAVPWSAIRRIGQSRLLALTIVVPFLGSLLIFNQHVVDFLSLSPDFMKRIFPSGDAIEQSRQATLNRLYYAYFGLSFLGIASFLFSLACPRQIKEHTSAREYAEHEFSYVSEARIGIIMSELATLYVYWLPEESYEEDGPLFTLSWVQTNGMPFDFQNFFNVAIIAIWIEDAREAAKAEQAAFGTQAETTGRSEQVITEASDQPKAEDQLQHADPELEDDLEPFGPYCDDRGEPEPEKIARALISGRRMDRPLVYGMQSAAMRDVHRRDILLLHYMALDHSKPVTRLSIATLYSLGFVVLFFPTAITFAQLLSNVVYRVIG